MRFKFYFGLTCLLIMHSVSAQEVQVSSFQHVVRWVSESNFPNYVNDPDVKDSLFSTTTKALQKKYNTQHVVLPATIDYDYISGFGKASIKKPSHSPGAFNVSILSWITRATTGFAVLWKMEVVVHQNGKTVYANNTEHELEHFSVSGYMNPRPWLSKTEFVAQFDNLINEVLGNHEPIPYKIVVGSVENLEAEAKQLITNPNRYLLKTKGNFLEGGNFTINLETEGNTFPPVTYKDGWDMSRTKIGLSEIAANLLSSVTGLTIGYNAKSRQKRFGKLEYDSGRKVRLRMEWFEETRKFTDGTVGGFSSRSPMITEVYEGEDLVAYFIYKADWIKAPEKVTLFSKELPPLTYSMHGRIKDVPVQVEYNPSEGLLTIRENNHVKVVVIMENVNPESRSFSNSKLSKNKKTISTSSQTIGKPRFSDPEWYYFYADPSLSSTQVYYYTEAILYLFFGMGNDESK